MEISEKNRPVKIGVYSLWGLTIFLMVFIFYIVGTNQRLFTPRYVMYLFLPNAQGMAKGAFVTVSGIKAGVVSNLELGEQEGQPGIRVTLKISKTFANRITSTSVATINTMGVLGDKYVDIIPGKVTDPLLPAGSSLQVRMPMDLGQFLTNANAALTEFEATLANVHQITDQALAGTGVLGTLTSDPSARNDLVQLLKNLKYVSHRIAAGTGTAGQLVQDTLLYHRLNRTAENLDRITTQIKLGQGTLGKLVADTSFYRRVNNIAVQTDSLLGKLQGNGSAGKLLNDDQLYDRLVTLTRSLTELTEDLKKNPKKYVSFSVF